MGIRCTQIMGLPKEAEVFLDQYGMKAQSTCPHCSGLIGPARRQYTIYADAKTQGMFDDGPLLHDYPLTGGGKAREIVQAVPWSTSPTMTPRRRFRWWTGSGLVRSFRTSRTCSGRTTNVTGVPGAAR